MTNTVNLIYPTINWMELIENNKDALFKIDLEHIGFFKPQDGTEIHMEVPFGNY